MSTKSRWKWLCPECDFAILGRLNRGNLRELAVEHLRRKHKIRLDTTRAGRAENPDRRAEPVKMGQVRLV